jgi:hypothetical protein
MKDIIYSLCMGNNYNNLYGCKNDAILFYNFISSFNNCNSLNELWLKPSLLLNENVVEDNIFKNIKENQSRFNKLLIYYSGHGFENGTLRIFNSNNTLINDFYLLKKINDVLTRPIDIYIILDCCFAGSFKLLNFDKIRNVYLIGSSCYNQNSSESITSKNNISKYLINGLEIKNNNITIGIFTFNFVKQLNYYRPKSIKNWKDIFYISNFMPVWSEINRISYQKPYLKW